MKYKTKEEKRAARLRNQKKYSQKPEVLARRRAAARKKYHSNPEYKKKQLDYAKSEKEKKRRVKQRLENLELKRLEDRKYRNVLRQDPKRWEQRKKTQRIWLAKKKKENNFYKVRVALSSRLTNWLWYKGSKKAAPIFKLVGCSKEEFKKYLESKFYPNKKTGELMNWKNYGRRSGKIGWEIDHIIPMDHFKNKDINNKDVQKEIMNYKNLQPMWADENRSKSNKLFK